MKGSSLRPVLVATLATLAGVTSARCHESDQRPSEGLCTGTVGPLPVELPLDPEPSFLRREDDVLFGEDGVMELSYGAGAVQVSARWEDMPMDADRGAHPIPTAGLDGDGLLERWTTVIDGDELTGGLEGAELILEAAGRDRIVGAFTLSFTSEGALTCTFDLRRAYELEDPS